MRNGGNEVARILRLRRNQHVLGGPLLDDAACPHDDNAIAEQPHHVEIVGHEQIAHSQGLFELLQQIEHDRLHRHVKRRGGFVANDQIAVKRGLRLSVGSWNTIWMRLRSGSRANRCGEMAPMSSPSKVMTPSVISMRRMIIVEVVDLPQPDSPTSPTLSPRFTAKLMPSTARKVSGSGVGLR